MPTKAVAPADRILSVPLVTGQLEEFVFLGTGNSGCIPDISCLVASKWDCRVCNDAADPHKWSKNRRMNTCAILRYRNSKGILRNILIDCGKTFYVSALEWMVKHQIDRIDAVILTHEHADATLGLDDLRNFAGKDQCPEPIPVYLCRDTMQRINEVFPYLVDVSKATGGGYVSSLDFRVFEKSHGTPFTVDGELEVVPIEVVHGTCNSGLYYSLGFRFGQDDLVYISDISELPDSSRHLVDGVRVLVLDCLRESPSYKSHFCLADSRRLIDELKPAQTFLIGMTHGVEHDQFQSSLIEAYPDGCVRVAFDGLMLKFQRR